MSKILILKRYISLVFSMSFTAIYIGISLFVFNCYAATPEEQYNTGINCYAILKNNPERQKYRHNWLNCVQKFASVYSDEPNHPLASSSMYRSAELYIDLYKISAIEKDKSEAIDLLNRIIKRYPLSTDNDMAEKLLSSILYGKSELKTTNSNSLKTENGDKKKSEKDDTSKISSDGNAYITNLRYWTTPDYTRIVINISEERRYVYQLLDGNPSMSQPKRLYLDIKKSLIGKNLPSHTSINDDLLLQARAGQRTDDTVRVVVDIKSFGSYKVFSMRDPFRVIIDVWGDKADKEIDTEELNSDTTKHVSNSSTGSRLSIKESDSQYFYELSTDINTPIKRSTKKLTKIDRLTPNTTISSEPTDVTLNSNTPSSLESVSSKISTKTATKLHSLLQAQDSQSPEETILKSSSQDKPEIALEINSEDTSHLTVKKSLKASTMVLSDTTRKLLRDTLTKNLEASSENDKSSYKIEPEKPTKESKNTISQSQELEGKDNKKFEDKLSNNYNKAAIKGTTRVVQIAPGSNVDRIKASSIAKQLALGVRTIVIDPGHGGRDPGASGHSKGVYEKDVVLAISKKLSRRIRERLNCKVIMTRSSDIYLTLEERTAIANTKSADLFVSLHCNASNDTSLVGIETYYLNLATDERAINVAARENATSRKNISDLESILNDLMKNAKINESSRLASVVQNNLYRGVAKKYSNIKNLGVKQAPFYVLLGASMPSILIETSFLSNQEECRRLTDSTYQNSLCDSIIDGIANYIRETNPQSL